MKRLSVSISLFVVMVFFGLPAACLQGHADDSFELPFELSQSSASLQGSFQLARLNGGRFVRRNIPAKSPSKLRGGLPRKIFPKKSFGSFSFRRINDLRHEQRLLFREINLKGTTFRVPRKDFVTPQKGVLQRSRNVRGSIRAQRNAVEKQFDTERLRR